MLAGCSTPPAATLPPTAPPQVDTIDVGVAFVPQAAEVAPTSKEGDEARFDLDGDGTPDIVEKPVKANGQQGVATTIRTKTGLLLVTGTIGASSVAEARRDATGVNVRLEPSYGEAGEARFSRSLRYRFATKDWEAGPSSLIAKQTTLPATPNAPPYPKFEVLEVAELRTAPVVEDAGGAPGGTATLHGNVIAEVAIGSTGIAIATRGDWSYVAIAPDTTMRANSLHSQGALGTLNRRATMLERALATPPWTCGWTETAKLRPQ